MSSNEKNRINVIFHPNRKEAGVRLYNTKTYDSIDDDDLNQLLYFKPAEDWDNSEFTICTRPSLPDVRLKDIGFIVNGVIVSLEAAMQCVDDIKEAKDDDVVT